jgi:hypothetical protein
VIRNMLHVSIVETRRENSQQKQKAAEKDSTQLSNSSEPEKWATGFL